MPSMVAAFDSGLSEKDDRGLASIFSAYTITATLWLLFATAVGIVLAYKFGAPDFGAGAWLTFGRLRPIHTNATFYGWASIALVGLAVVMPTTIGVIALFTVSGLVGTPALAARAAGLQELLPERAWAAGFSGLYAAGGVGFGAAGLIVAALLGPAGIRTALLACVALAAVAAIVGAFGEERLMARLPLPPKN